MKMNETSYKVFCLVARYLNNAPCAINKELIDMVTGGDKDSEERAFSALLAELLGVDSTRSQEEKQMFREYFLPMVKKLNPEEYEANAYLKAIPFKEGKIGAWEIKLDKYRAYEGFVYDNPTVYFDGKVVPRIGFFDREYSYPAIYENGREWMLITPNEIRTMASPVSRAKGRVLTFGLGLGYYAFSVSEKSEVETVTIVERDSNAIELFKEIILPYVKNKNKINIVKSDAFEYMESGKTRDFDTIFVDLWHDPSDGVELYKKAKSYERMNPEACYDYWIEDSIKLYL